MKTILVLTDLSIKAERAAEFALGIAVNCKANLLLCSAIESNNESPALPGYDLPVMDRVRSTETVWFDLKALMLRLERRFGEEHDPGGFQPEITCLAERGSLTDMVKKIAYKGFVELIVTASHHSNAFSRLIFGSHTNQLIEGINCPVLLVPETARFNAVRAIVYATDFTFSNKKAIMSLAKLGKAIQAKVEVNYIARGVEPVLILDESIGRYLSRQLEERYPPVTYHTLKGSSAKRSLRELTGESGNSILAVVHKQYNFFERLFHSSFSKLLAANTLIPLLILPFRFSAKALGSEDQPDVFFYESDYPVG